MGRIGLLGGPRCGPRGGLFLGHRPSPFCLVAGVAATAGAVNSASTDQRQSEREPALTTSLPLEINSLHLRLYIFFPASLIGESPHRSGSNFFRIVPSEIRLSLNNLEAVRA